MAQAPENTTNTAPPRSSSRRNISRTRRRVPAPQGAAVVRPGEAGGIFPASQAPHENTAEQSPHTDSPKTERRGPGR